MYKYKIMYFWGLERKLNHFTNLTIIGTNFFPVWLPESSTNMSVIHIFQLTCTHSVSFFRFDWSYVPPPSTKRHHTKKPKAVRTEGDALTLFPLFRSHCCDMLFQHVLIPDWHRPMICTAAPSFIKTCTVPLSHHRCAEHPCCSTNPFVAEIKTLFLI